MEAQRTLRYKIEDGSQHPASIKLLGLSEYNHRLVLPIPIQYAGGQLHFNHTLPREQP